MRRGALRRVKPLWGLAALLAGLALGSLLPERFGGLRAAVEAGLRLLEAAAPLIVFLALVPALLGLLAAARDVGARAGLISRPYTTTAYPRPGEGGAVLRMTKPRTRKIGPLLLALGLAATVALPAATALDLATQGNAAADAAWNAAGSAYTGGATCMGTTCAKLGAGGFDQAQGRAHAEATWGLYAEVDEEAYLDAAMELAEQARAEAEARAREALEARERVHADVAVRHDLRADGDAEAAMDSSADAEGHAGLDGLFAVEPRPVRVDFEDEKRLKAEAEAKARAEAESALGLLARLLAELQSRVAMGVEAAVGAVADAGAIVGGALGLVQSVEVRAHESADVAASLGAVPQVELPRLEPPSLAYGGSASLAAKGQALVEGAVQG